MASGIRRSANRPKTAKHLRRTSEKKFENTTQEMRDRRHGESDAWAAKQLEKFNAEEAARVKLPDPVPLTPAQQRDLIAGIG